MERRLLPRARLVGAAFILAPTLAAQPAPPLPLDQPFTIALGSSVRVGDPPVAVRFDRVLNDSRCPVGARCVWEGDAVLRASVVVPGQRPVSVELRLRPGTPASVPGSQARVEVGDYLLDVTDLAPAPALTPPAGPRQTRATFELHEVPRHEEAGVR